MTAEPTRGTPRQNEFFQSFCAKGLKLLLPEINVQISSFCVSAKVGKDGFFVDCMSQQHASSTNAFLYKQRGGHRQACRKDKFGVFVRPNGGPVGGTWKVGGHCTRAGDGCVFCRMIASFIDGLGSSGGSRHARSGQPRRGSHGWESHGDRR